MPTHKSHHATAKTHNAPARNTSTQHTKPARRTHRHLLTPPLAQKNGIDPIQLVLPQPEELPEELAPGGRAPPTIAA